MSAPTFKEFPVGCNFVDKNSKHWVNHVQMQVSGSISGTGYCIALNILKSIITANFNYNKTWDRMDFGVPGEIEPAYKFFSIQSGCCGNTDMNQSEPVGIVDGSSGHQQFYNGVPLSCESDFFPTIRTGFDIQRNATTGLFSVNFSALLAMNYVCIACFSPPCVNQPPNLSIIQSGIAEASLLGVYTVTLSDAITCTNLLGAGNSNYSVTLTVTLS